jgi:hypothetical protein
MPAGTPALPSTVFMLRAIILLKFLLGFEELLAYDAALRRRARGVREWPAKG